MVQALVHQVLVYEPLCFLSQRDPLKSVNFLAVLSNSFRTSDNSIIFYSSKIISYLCVYSMFAGKVKCLTFYLSRTIKSIISNYLSKFIAYFVVISWIKLVCVL